MKVLCKRCGKEMVPEEDLPGRWSCQCGVTARLEDKGRISRLYKWGGLEAVAEPGKRVITEFPFGNSGQNDWLIYEELIE